MHVQLLRRRLALLAAVTALLALAATLSGSRLGLSSGSTSSSSLMAPPPLCGDDLQPPVAPRRQHTENVTFSGANGVSVALSDPYHWLRDDSRRSPEVLAHLEAENAYASAWLARLAPLADALADDMDGRLPPVEVAAPHVRGGWLYLRTRGPGDDYWTTRRVALPAGKGASGGEPGASPSGLADAVAAAAAAAAAEAAAGGDVDAPVSSAATPTLQLVLDENGLAAGQAYWDAGAAEVSPDGRLVAVAYDTTGDECYSLQVFDIASQQPLLAQPIPSCAGDVVWWGSSSDTLLFSASDDSVRDRSIVTIHALQLQPQPQPGPASTPARVAGVAHLLYTPAEGEAGLSLSATKDGAYVLLTSRLDGATRVQALPTSYLLQLGGAQAAAPNSSSRNRSSGSSSSADATPVVPAAAWQQVVSPDDDVDVLALDHLGPAAAAAASSAAANGSTASQGSGGVFVALIDDDESPDGELVLIDTRQGLARPHMEVLVRNRLPHSESDDSSGDGSGDSSDDGSESSSGRPSSSSGGSSSSSLAGAVSSKPAARLAGANGSTDARQPPEQQQRQQPQQPQQTGEITDFAVHASAGFLAVGVRRQAVCAVHVYRLHGAAAAAAAEQDGSSTQTGQLPRVVVLQTGSGRGSSSSECAPASSGRAAEPADTEPHAAAAAGAAAVGGGSAAGVVLCWVLVPQDPTLLLTLAGTAGPADDPWLVVEVGGIISPSALVYVHLATQRQVQVWQEAIVGFSPACYAARLEWAASADGTAVPLTLAFRRDLMKADGSNMALLHGYGAYGSRQWPSFNPADLALLDRGVLLAVAHVRGGGELGSAWHLAGKRFSKKNTFADFLAAGRHLVDARYTRADRLAAWGRSAGGLTLGAALNLQPGFAAAAVLDVPFLDVLSTMRDASLPLTVKERGEWGDPLNDQAAFEYIRSYSPLANLRPDGAYPALLLTASLYDTRVNFWEPAKYVAALRHLQQQQQKQQHGCAAGGGGARPVLLLTDMHAGHFAASGASSRLSERASKAAFLLHALGWRGDAAADGGGR